MKGDNFAHGASVCNGNSMANGPPAISWARELMIRDPTSWTLTLGENPA